jgi:hypothetical protein
MTTVKHTKDEEMLISVAESIGSTLGAIAAKAAAGPRALLDSDFGHSVESEGKKILRKGKSAARKGQKLVASKFKSNKLTKAVRKALPKKKAAAKRKTSSAKKTGKRSVSKVNAKARKGAKR